MNIYESISKAMAEIGAISKDRKNLQQGFMFRGIDAVMNTLHPVLEKNKIFVVPEVIEQVREERTTNKGGTLIYSICKIKYTFYAEDGTSVTAVVIGEGMDSGDKATNKAMSIAFKYAMFQVFCIPTEEMADPDAETPAPSNKGKAAPKKDEQTQQKQQAQQTQKAEQTQQAPSGQNEGSFNVQTTDLIDDKSVALLREMFEQRGIDEAFVCKLYKIDKLENTTLAKYANIAQHLPDIKKKQEEKK